MKRQILNQLINLFWSVLAFAPVIAFWLAAGPGVSMFVLIAISLCVLFLPENMYSRMQVSENPVHYEKIGVKIFRIFTQDGDMITRVLAKDQGRIKIGKMREGLLSLGKKIAVYERYHLTCLVFFLLTTLYAAVRADFAIAVIITMANVLYNLYPLFLQQYNKLRVNKIRDRGLITS